MQRKVILAEQPKDSININDPEIDYRLLVAFRTGEYPTFFTFSFGGYEEEEWHWIATSFEGNSTGFPSLPDKKSENGGLKEAVRTVTEEDPEDWEVVLYDTMELKHQALIEFIQSKGPYIIKLFSE